MSLVPHQTTSTPDDHAPEIYDDPFTGRRPPQDIESERITLGSMILDEQATIDCQNAVWPEDYLLPAHATLHRVIVEMRGRGEQTHPQLLCAELRRLGELERIGGPAAIAQLIQSVPTAASGAYHAEIVHECAVRRRLGEAGVRITQASHAGQQALDELLSNAAAEISSIAHGTDDDGDFVTPGSTMASTLAAVEAAKSGTGLTGLATGFTDLDSLTSGFQPGQLIVLAARPGMGKSTLAMDFARACSIKHQVPSAFISLEMGINELNMRLLSAEARVGLHHLRSGNVTDDDWSRIARRLPDITAAPLYVTEAGDTLGAIQAKIRRLKNKHPELGLVIIDYLQLVRLGGRPAESREREVSEISRSLKLLAKELELPIVALAQLNRGPEMRADKRPTKSDLRESGSLEQDADLVLLLYRDDAYEPESPRAGEVDLIVDKHRNGPTATITMANQLHYSRFVDMAQT